MCVHCCLVLYGLSKELVFAPVASALIGTNSDRLIVASFGQEPETYSALCLEDKSFPLIFRNGLKDGRTHSYHISIMISNAMHTYRLIQNQM